MLSPLKQLTKRLGYTGANAALRAVGRPTCAACGRGAIFRRQDVLWPELIAGWQLTPQWTQYFNRREGDPCTSCQASLRDRHLATGIAAELRRRTGVRGGSLREVCARPEVATIDVAEINSCGRLHPFLASLPRLKYSEYGSQRLEVPHEDLTRLSYADDSFDLVLTSETLEHVPDVDACLREIARVLRPGGRHLFTIPVVWDRPQTLQRATIEGGSLRHLVESPSYHLGKGGRRDSDFLVFYEFGADVVDRIARAGFDVELDRLPGNPAVVNLVATVSKR